MRLHTRLKKHLPVTHLKAQVHDCVDIQKTFPSHFEQKWQRTPGTSNKMPTCLRPLSTRYLKRLRDLSRVHLCIDILSILKKTTRRALSRLVKYARLCDVTQRWGSAWLYYRCLWHHTIMRTLCTTWASWLHASPTHTQKLTKFCNYKRRREE